MIIVFNRVKKKKNVLVLKVQVRERERERDVKCLTNDYFIIVYAISIDNFEKYLSKTHFRLSNGLVKYRYTIYYNIRKKREREREKQPSRHSKSVEN